ncbi:MAG: VCBS repeat-containing protein [Acidobacteria bacterium]|nr:VCBS repeat-containing protein [Acidobacteriota bacterium]MCW5967738.1 VCBS repeat-containing protein [Blastocatellales bacterium]
MRRFPFAIVLVLLIGVSVYSGNTQRRSVEFVKTVLDREFRSEGVAVADINRDGRLDVIAGRVWYEAPNWKMHEIAEVQRFDAAKGYSDSFVNFAADINRDGWPDLIRIDMPGTHPVVWHENPGKNGGYWPVHLLFRNACNESPAFTRLAGTGPMPVLVFAFDDSQMAWYEPGKAPTEPFISYPISTSEHKGPGRWRYSHGLGVGDINGDGRPDVLVKEGYWEAPADPRNGPWRFVPADFGEDCAQIEVYDVDGDGLNDVVTTSAHRIGVWWRKQRRGPNNVREFVPHTIDESFSQSHALVLTDINGDGLKDIVTGKRFWAHGPTGDINPDDPAVIYWYELQRSRGGVRWIRHRVDDDSGVGTQFVVMDINGDRRPDIITSNKKGVFVFLQKKRDN